MLRKLLACLALLTGLAAAGAPAQAEVAVAMASRIEASTPGNAAVAGQMAAGSARPIAAHRIIDRWQAPLSFSVSAFISTVYLQIDRARE